MTASITSQENLLPFYDCDFRRRMRISSILKITAELAGRDYTEKGLGHEFLWEQGYVFLLSRISIRIKKYPQNADIIRSSTWECGRKGAMFLRGYEIEKDGEVYADGESGWIVVNPETRRIIKPAQFPWQMPQRTDHPTGAIPIDKIGHGETDAGIYKVQLCDLDANGHVYNAFYADIAMNMMSEEEFSRDITNFRINFCSEAKKGEEIILKKTVSDEKILITGFVGDKVCFETEFLY